MRVLGLLGAQFFPERTIYNSKKKKKKKREREIRRKESRHQQNVRRQLSGPRFPIREIYIFNFRLPRFPPPNSYCASTRSTHPPFTVQLSRLINSVFSLLIYIISGCRVSVSLGSFYIHYPPRLYGVNLPHPNLLLGLSTIFQLSERKRSKLIVAVATGLTSLHPAYSQSASLIPDCLALPSFLMPGVVDVLTYDELTKKDYGIY